MTGGGRIEAPVVDGGSPVLAMSGEHDLSTAPELRARLHELGETSAIIIDLDETTFVDHLHQARAAVRKQQRPGVDKWGLYMEALRTGLAKRRD